MLEKSNLRGHKNSARLEARGTRLSPNTILGSQVFMGMQS